MIEGAERYSFEAIWARSGAPMARLFRGGGREIEIEIEVL